MIARIISGGQTGADEGGLQAARLLGIATGGWMPKGFLRESPCGRYHRGDPEFGRRYGLREHPLADYPPRTLSNIHHSNCTVYFLRGTKSRGCRLNERLCAEQAKPFLAIDLYHPEPAGFRRWLALVNPTTLNVAGNRQSLAPGIDREVREYLLESLPALGYRRT